jgi:hypothetical protein
MASHRVYAGAQTCYRRRERKDMLPQLVDFLLNAITSPIQPNTEKLPLLSSSNLATDKPGSEFQLFATSYGFISSVPADTVSGNAVKGEICFRSKLRGSLKTQLQVLPSLMTIGRHPDSTSFINDKPNFQTQLTGRMH